VEVLVALCVVLLALVPLIRLHVVSISTLDSTRQMTQAVLLANAKLAETIATDVPEVGNAKGIIEDPESGTVLYWRSVISDTDRPELKVAGLEGIREVRVELSWKDGHREGTVSLCTFVHVTDHYEVEAPDHLDGTGRKQTTTAPRTHR